MMKTFLRFLQQVLLLCLTSLFVFLTCNEEPTKPPVGPPSTAKPTIKLEVQFEDFTEVLLKVTVSDTSKWKYVTIHRDGKLVHFESFLNKDTMITDAGLESNTTYSYQASLIENGRAIDSSVASAKTREYGWHAWRFEVDTLGDDESGAYSIFAFSKNDAWVAGHFRKYLQGNPPWTTYAVAHWDGNTWTQYKIEYSINSPTYGHLVFGFALNDVWLLTTRLNRFDGASWTSIPNEPGLVLSIGRSAFVANKSSVFFVGANGGIAHWDRTKLKPVPSPVTCDLEDIYGEGELMYAAGTSNDYARSVLLKLEGEKVTVVDSMKTDDPLQISSIWFKQSDSVFAYAGSVNHIVYRGRTIKPKFVDQEVPYCLKIRGTGIHNIWSVGHFHYAMHYDGKTWKYFLDAQKHGLGHLKSLDVHEDYFYAAGHTILSDGSWRAIVVRGYRY